MVSKSGDRFLVVTTDLEGNSFADYALEAIVETGNTLFWTRAIRARNNLVTLHLRVENV